MDEADVRELLGGVEDPDLGDDIVSLGLVNGVEVDDGVATVSLALGAPYAPTESAIAADVREVLTGAGLAVEITAKRPAAIRDGEGLPGGKKGVAGAAGKGGGGQATGGGNLAAGIHSDTRTTLDEPLENDDTVVAMPHRDTDDDGSYDFVTSDGGDDGPYTDADGSIVTDAGSAVLTDTADVTMADDVSGGNLVTVDEVFLPNGGFVTAHDGNVSEDALGSVRGTSEYLGPGYHETVHIVLDDPFTGDNATVVPMAHTDTNNNEQYDFVRSEGRNDGPYTDDNGAVIDQATLDIAAGFHVDTQPSDGVTVTVDHVDLSEDGYVTIHDSSLNAGEVTGSVRGSSAYLEAGYYDSVTITLDDPLRQSTTVIPMAHRETDGDESYDFVTSEGADDGPVTTSEGELVIDSATATVLSQVSFEPQTTSDTNVTVQSATLHDGGFVTIHDASLLEGAVFDSVRGTSEYLRPGTHEDVTVALDEFEESSTLIAMPHLDTNGNQQYDFVASEGANDGPYVAKDIVVAPAMVDVSGMGQGSARVTLNNQTANGAAGSVTVSSATLPEGGFLTIHDGTLLDGDALGSVRGTSDYLEAGDHSDIEVSLDEPHTASGSIIAMPHRDTNGNEAYDFVSSEGETDAPYTTSDDEIVLDPAALTVRSASVDFEDQETDGDSVTVASVTMSQGGFVTIHDDTVGDDAIGSVVGTSDYLAAGQSSNVEVDVDISASGQYFAMPHLDTNDNEAYDFVSSEGSADGPYTTEGGDIVLAGAQVTVEESGGDGTETGGQPGFGAVVAVLALLGAALLARRS